MAVADLDGDTKADIIVGAGNGAGLVSVLNGADGTVGTPAFAALDLAVTGGVRVATGDLNGDGTPDLIVAPGGSLGTSRTVRAYDGQTFAEIDLTAGGDPFWPFGELFDKGFFVAGRGA